MTTGISPYVTPVPSDSDPALDVLETVLVASHAMVDIGGVMANAETFNGAIPGPTLRFNVGDTAIVRLINLLEHPTGIHWHGIELANSADGTEVTQEAVVPAFAVPPPSPAPAGGTYLYKFKLAHAALLHNGNVLFIPELFAATDTLLWDPGDSNHATAARTLNGAATGLTGVLFCGAHCFLQDGKLLVVGGGTNASGTVDAWKFNPVAETWQKTAGSMTAARWYPTTVALGEDSGRVLVTNGGPVSMEIYSETTDSFVPVHGPAGPGDNSAGRAFPELYPGLHLLPSAKVMITGGSSETIEVFSPPYLFNSDGTPASRPVIDSYPDPGVGTIILHGSTFEIETAQASDIAKVVMVRPMAVTHQTDAEQRVLALSWTLTSPTTLTVTAPDGRIFPYAGGGGHTHVTAPRGYYMLFVINSSNVPSEAKFVRLI